MQFESIGYVYILPVVCTFGIAGNIFTLVVLFRERFQGTAYSYLKAIAALDLMSLVFVLPTITRCSQCPLRDSYFGPVFEAYLHVFVGDVFVKSSFWTVVIFTAERCITSCFPASVLSLLIQRRAWGGREGAVTRNPSNHRHSVATSVAIVMLVVAIENTPTFWNYTIREHEVVRREIVKQNGFFRFYIWFDAVFSCLIPSFALIFLNITLIRFLIKRDRRPPAPSAFTVPTTIQHIIIPLELTPQHHRGMSSSHLAAATPISRRTRREQTRILVTLVGIIILLLATILPIFALNLVGHYAELHSRDFLTSRMIISILLAVNSSGNFILYCMLNPRFWALFKAIFGLDRCGSFCCPCSCKSYCRTTSQQTPARIVVSRVTPLHSQHHSQLRPPNSPQAQELREVNTTNFDRNTDTENEGTENFTTATTTTLPGTSFNLYGANAKLGNQLGVWSTMPLSPSCSYSSGPLCSGQSCRGASSSRAKEEQDLYKFSKAILNRRFYHAARKIMAQLRTDGNSTNCVARSDLPVSHVKQVLSTDDLENKGPEKSIATKI